MANITNLAASFVIFAVLAVLCVTIYEGVESSYNITRSDILTINETTRNIADQFKEIYLIEGISQSQTGITKLNPPGGATADIIGGLRATGIGAFKVVTGIIIIPYQITNIVLTYYVGDIPGIVGGLLMMIVVYVSMIMLAVVLGRDRVWQSE